MTSFNLILLLLLLVGLLYVIVCREAGQIQAVTLQSPF